MPSSDIQKTTIYFPRELWERATRRALEERLAGGSRQEASFNTLVVEGLELRLAKKLKKGARK